MSDKEFFEKMMHYIRSRYPTEVQASVLYLTWGIHGEKLKWQINAVHAPEIYETVDGKIGTLSAVTVAVEDTVEYYLREVYKVGESRFDKERQIMRDLLNKDNWPKYRSEFKVLIDRLERGEEVAKKITERTGIEVKHYVPEPPNDNALFCTEFDSTGMSGEQKMEEIRKHLDAIDAAYDEFQRYDKKRFGETFEKKIN